MRASTPLIRSAGNRRRANASSAATGNSSRAAASPTICNRSIRARPGSSGYRTSARRSITVPTARTFPFRSARLSSPASAVGDPRSLPGSGDARARPLPPPPRATRRRHSATFRGSAKSAGSRSRVRRSPSSSPAPKQTMALQNRRQAANGERRGTPRSRLAARAQSPASIASRPGLTSAASRRSGWLSSKTSSPFQHRWTTSRSASTCSTRCMGAPPARWPA